VIEGFGKLANLIAPANIDARIPSSASYLTRAFGQFFHGFVIRADTQKLTSNPTNNAAAATAPAIFKIGESAAPVLYANCRRRRCREVPCFARAREWLETFPRRRVSRPVNRLRHLLWLLLQLLDERSETFRPARHQFFSPIREVATKAGSRLV